MENFQEELIKALTKMRSTMPVGTPWWGFDVKSKPLGVQLYQGQILARDMYPVHWNYIQTYRTIVSETEWHTYAEAHNGFCPYFSSGDEVGTYRMPMIVDVHPRFIREGEDVGKFVEPGLPNITGYAGFTDNDSLTYRIKADSTSGAFYGKEVTGMYPFNSNTSSVINFGEGGYFDAARCSPIYGSSDTVQPPAINMLIGEYVVSGYQEFSLTTAAEIKNGIDALQATVGTVIREDRLNVILEKYNKSYIIDTWKSDTEWYRVWSDGWIEQGGILIALLMEQ